jgi:hypothetical protein
LLRFRGPGTLGSRGLSARFLTCSGRAAI